MCGFVGAIRTEGIEQDILHLARAASYIAHRGPDESVGYINDELVFISIV